ncbi:LuxR family transcriptional regulator [Elizabethkingia anophelis]|uniref:response regulator transcription factor n=1 Tax=Elizabethkingia anophelis TaxID=1117645 RepID=UPI00099A98DF|nr:helix-turn-helix transcriptional regulator [Elizabethkingia anophelis]ELB0070114.1 helix-turn-helix transcriptional regulator [Elizabethkingia anophelis]ELB1894758.1 helix-turn-helix transcriptional regulator [Elizabethkingia anophelis]MCT3807138.1 helix-turn-helix transcriptional regulator [Elizabethkingia anophelis]MCT3814327.1 helix-turn-helix transcriptional regulator [Elizabethkingia anophelis]MCT3821420.1 helix-turn-helix transcriptional regulator [Elizabethkingia anophelis]
MDKNRHILIDVWNKYPESMSNQYGSVSKPPPIERLMADFFTVGPYYYYVIFISDSTISNCYDTFLEIHGLQKYPKHLKEIIDLIHPDDLLFVIEAEAWTIEIYNQIGFEHQLKLKSGYCFRMKVANGKYELFHHQALHTHKDKNGRLLQTVNIHTNINHITQQNNFIVTVSGIKDRNDFYSKKIHTSNVENTIDEKLTKRELEILNMLINGYSDKEIAVMLCISFHTVRTHHKNILKKTKAKSSIELIRKQLAK